MTTAALATWQGPAFPERLRVADLGIVPLLLVMPFLYVPKLVEGDTQPWVLTAALIAFFTFRTASFLVRSDLVFIGAAILCVVAYAVRSTEVPDLVRATYTMATFSLLWVVVRRAGPHFLPTAVRATIVIWLIAGAYQYLALRLGLPVSFAGRFVEGRSGVPSLTAEPSYYGSLSMIQMMFLLAQRRPGNAPYIAAAAISVVLSGSALAILLFVFPLLKMPSRAKIVAIVCLPLLVFADYSLSSAGVTSRFADFGAGGTLIDILLDPSLNLRLGHIWFTLGDHLLTSLSLSTPVQFMTDYNAFARSTSVLIDNESNFALTAAGEMIYGSGLFGALLLAGVGLVAARGYRTSGAALQKLAFVAACMLNPIALSNVFLVAFIQQREA